MTGGISKRLQKPHSKSSQMRTDLAREAVAEISDELLLLLSDAFSLFLKAKKFHWHVTGPHFREYHLMLDEQAGQIFAMTDVIVERARKMGASTVRSISDISRHQRLKDNNEEGLAPVRMFEELRADNQQLTIFLRQLHEVCERHNMLPLRVSSRSGLTKPNVGHGFYQRHWSISDSCRRNTVASKPNTKEMLKNPTVTRADVVSQSANLNP
jgi:starvation-inducible DNA-binding protein